MVVCFQITPLWNYGWGSCPVKCQVQNRWGSTFVGVSLFWCRKCILWIIQSFIRQKGMVATRLAQDILLSLGCSGCPFRTTNLIHASQTIMWVREHSSPSGFALFWICNTVCNWIAMQFSNQLYQNVYFTDKLCTQMCFIGLNACKMWFF